MCFFFPPVLLYQHRTLYLYIKLSKAAGVDGAEADDEKKGAHCRSDLMNRSGIPLS